MKNALYWTRVQERAKELGSDGCTNVTELYHSCCLEHDIAYRTGMDVNGTVVSRRHADAEFRRCMQSRSPLGRISPISWIRWIGVRIGGRFLWNHE